MNSNMWCFMLNLVKQQSNFLPIHQPKEVICGAVQRAWLMETATHGQSRMGRCSSAGAHLDNSGLASSDRYCTLCSQSHCHLELRMNFHSWQEVGDGLWKIYFTIANIRLTTSEVWSGLLRNNTMFSLPKCQKYILIGFSFQLLCHDLHCGQWEREYRMTYMSIDAHPPSLRSLTSRLGE